METLQEKAYNLITQKLEDGFFKAGEVYSETKLAEAFGISRTPLRSALIRLEHDGYIDILPGKGFQLHELSEKDILNTYQIRMAVESFCAMNLAEHRQDEKGQETIARLSEHIEKMAAAIEAGAPVEEVLDHDLAFHQILVRSAENQDLSSVYQQCMHHLRTTARDTLNYIDGRQQEALGEHREILRTIQNSRDSVDMDVYASVLRHLSRSRDLSLEVEPLKSDDSDGNA